MALSEKFSTQFDDDLAKKFLRTGYVVKKVENFEDLTDLRQQVVSIACTLIKIPEPEDHSEFLNSIHDRVSVDELNDFRMTIYQQMNGYSWFRPTYFSLARTALNSIVGNELAMQNRINFSLQYPNDRSSLLPIHSDSFSGETPFQVVPPFNYRNQGSVRIRAFHRG